MAGLPREHWEDKACTYYGRGLLYHFMGEFDLAIADYTRAIQIMSSFPDAHEALGDAYEDLGQHDKAIVDYDLAAQFSPDRPEALNARCWARAIRGRTLNRALADCNEAVKADPRSWSYLDSRCLVNYRLGNYAAAISDCDEALEH